MLQIVEGEAEHTHLRGDVGQFLVEKILTLEIERKRLGIVGDEVADTAAVEDDFSALQIVERSESGVGVDTQLFGYLAHRGDTLALTPLLAQDALAHSVGYLEVYRFLFLEVHVAN